MARPLRLDPELGIHHIYTRGTKRWIIFRDDVDRRKFLRTLSIVANRYQLKVLAYCLMDNHFHLVVQCPRAGLSDALRDLKSIYARWFNDRHRSSGPIFEDRFGSKIVMSERQLRQTVRYVHRNPLAVDPALDLATYRWSSHAIYLGTRAAPQWFDVNRAGALFGNYKQDVERPVESDKVQNLQPASASSEDVPDTSSLAPPTLTDIVIAVAFSASASVADVHPSRRNGLIGVALVVALDYGGFSVAEIMEPLGYRTTKATHSAVRRARKRVEHDNAFQQLVKTCLARLQYVRAA